MLIHGLFRLRNVHLVSLAVPDSHTKRVWLRETITWPPVDEQISAPALDLRPTKVAGFPFLASHTSPSKALILQQEIGDLTELYIEGVKTM